MSMNARITRRTALRSLAAGAGALALPALAQSTTKVTFGYTAVTDFATVFVAREEGYFGKRGLDHVVLTGGGATSKAMTGIGLVAKPGSNIKSAQDCVGKKIGVPGLGAFLHVGFRAWLKSQGVDYTKVTFVEAAFPQHGDLLRGGSLDAVVTADPFMARIIATGAGYVASYYSTFLPDGLPTLVFTARRDWVQKNQAAAKAFQAAIGEAAAFINNPKNNAKVREHIGKYIKLPPEVLASVQLSPPLPVVQEPQLGWWADQMLDQKLLKAKPAMANLIVK